MESDLDRMMRLPEVLEVTGLSHATIWRWVKSGDFPAPVKLGGIRTRSIGWRFREVQRWFDSRERFDAELCR